MGALRDFGAVHERLASGFVVDAQLDGDARVVTFANGAVAREVLINVDDDARRLVYSAAGGRLVHHNASNQVFAEGDGRSRFVWIADLLPNELAEHVSTMMDQGAMAAKQTIEARVARSAEAATA